MKILNKQQVILLHQCLLAAFGGSDGIRDEGLLESAISTPFQSFGEVDAYPSLQQKAARLCYGLVKNHAFVDGNKRIGAHIMLAFLEINGIELSYTQEELITVILNVASDKCSFEELVRWIISHQS